MFQKAFFGSFASCKSRRAEYFLSIFYRTMGSDLSCCRRKDEKLDEKGQPLVEVPVEGVAVEEVGDCTKVCERVFLVCSLGLWGVFGLYTVSPKKTVVIQHNGKITSVTTKTGLHWAPALFRDEFTVYTGEAAFETEVLKIVDKTGVPIIVSAIIVYKVVDVLKAAFEVNDYQKFVRAQSTAALKIVVQKYTYEELKVEGEQLSQETVSALQARVEVAGVQVQSMTLNELNYAPEIAGAMLKKQQAGALLEAREIIVDGAVGIAIEAVKKLEEQGGMTVSSEDKVKIMTNIITVLTGEGSATPVLPVGA